MATTTKHPLTPPLASFILDELFSIADPEKAVLLQRYFKTGKGQYAEGDVFMGITMPTLRNVIKHSATLPFSETQKLLNSEYHDARMAGFLLLVKQFRRTKDPAEHKKIFGFYLRNARHANNWDLVDMSCRDIVGAYLLDKPDRSVLYRLAESDNLWEVRISIVSTWFFIKHAQLVDTLTLATQLLPHPHDLIHKAVGWMLREVGKKDSAALRDFLTAHHAAMSRTTLRYAIEKFDEEERAQWRNCDFTVIIND
jgi:3-methyladenine DNA glycosylase AlkD